MMGRNQDCSQDAEEERREGEDSHSETVNAEEGDQRVEDNHRCPEIVSFMGIKEISGLIRSALREAGDDKSLTTSLSNTAIGLTEVGESLCSLEAAAYLAWFVCRRP